MIRRQGYGFTSARACVLSLVFMTLLMGGGAFAAVQYLGTDSGESGGSGSGFSFAISIHPETTLVVGFAHTSQNKTISGMILQGGTGGDAHLIELPDTREEDGKNERICMFYLVNPPLNATTARVNFTSDFKGKIGGLFYYKGVDLTEPIGKNTAQWSNDPFNGGAPLTVADLPIGCSIATGLSADKGDVEIKNAIAGDNFLVGGGSRARVYTRWPRSSTWPEPIAASALAEIIVPPASGRFVSNVNPNWDKYDGNGVAAVAVINPPKCTVTYVSDPANGGVFSGGASAMFPGTGSTSFSVAAKPGFAYTGISQTNGTLTGSPSSFTLSDISANTIVTASFQAVIRTVSYGAVEFGTLSGPTQIQDSIGSINFTAVPATGYRLKGTPSATNGTVTGSGSNWTLSNVTGNVTLSAVFEPIVHDVIYSSGTGGLVSGAAKIQDTVGAITITTTPAPGHGLTGPPTATNGTIIPKEENTWTLKDVTGNTVVSASFAPLFHPIDWNVSTDSPVEGVTGGTVSGLSGTIQDGIGVVAFTALANNGYKLLAPIATNGTLTGVAPNFTLSSVTEATAVTIVFQNTRPEITLMPYDLTLECGNSYTLASARTGMYALDAEDGPINTTTILVGGVTFPLTEVGEHHITYNVVDSTGLAALQAVRTVSIVDTLAPAITVNGASSVTVECGSTYVDAGATANDICDGAVAVVTTGSVNSLVPGTYTLTYSAQDSQGNSASASRTVVVKDTTAPVIELTGEGIVTVYQGATYVEAGAALLEECDSSAAVVITGTVDTTVAGSYTLYYNATDASGNDAEEVTRTVQVVSLADPSVMSVQVDGPFSVVVGWNQDLAILDAALVASNYTVSGSGAGTLSAQPTSVEAAGTQSVRLRWTNAGEMLNGKDIIITVKNSFADNFGNVIAGKQGADTNGAIGIAPVITLTGGMVTVECSLGSYVEPGVSALDNVDGSVNVTTSGTIDIDTTGSYLLTYTAKDQAGNTATATRSVIVEDHTAPVIVTNGSGNMNISCGYEFVDPGATAMDACEGDLTAKVVTGGDVIDTSMPGAVFTISYTVTDTAGNAATPVSRTLTVVDQDGPEITLTGNNPLVLDGAASYVEYGAVAIDACGDVDYTGSIVISGAVNALLEGTYEVTYTATDSVGNSSSVVRVVEVKRQACRLHFDLEIEPNPALPGDTVTLEAVELSGSCNVGALHFQWEKRSSNKADGFVTIATADDGPLLVLEAVTLDDAGDYRCVVSDAMMSETTPVVTLEVGTGIPAVSGLGILLASAAALTAGVAALRKRRD